MHRETSAGIMVAATELGLRQFATNGITAANSHHYLLPKTLSQRTLVWLWCPDGIKSPELLPAFLQRHAFYSPLRGYTGITTINSGHGDVDVDRIVDVLRRSYCNLAMWSFPARTMTFPPSWAIYNQITKSPNRQGLWLRHESDDKRPRSAAAGPPVGNRRRANATSEDAVVEGWDGIQQCASGMIDI
ncbi:hypothetical protein F5148DRAFT_1146731 [Russula earlei]|uniref:Uncharacterized protein n=1 Tax=Russula earlei TaxID=71964 RepID=A0ACC0UJ30_9AGAM|nr:hypothetical protein F5148DRAFT_1146731 [Russula earlei]